MVSETCLIIGGGCLRLLLVKFTGYIFMVPSIVISILNVRGIVSLEDYEIS